MKFNSFQKDFFSNEKNENAYPKFFEFEKGFAIKTKPNRLNLYFPFCHNTRRTYLQQLEILFVHFGVSAY